PRGPPADRRADLREPRCHRARDPPRARRTRARLRGHPEGRGVRRGARGGMTTAVTTYVAVKALHVMAAFAAFGLPFAYPFLLPYLHRHHPRALPGVHDVQHRLNVRLTGPGTVALFAFGAYMASTDDLWGETWVVVPLAILAVIVVAGGAIVPWTAQLADLARADVEAA